MIKLTLNPGKGEKAFCFDKKIILIGKMPSADEAAIDLALNEGNIEPIHLKIEEEAEAKYTIQNLANDPLATLNGLPFGKRNLKNKDLLQVGGQSILFENEKKELSSFTDYPKVSLKEDALKIVDRAIKQTEKIKPAELDLEENDFFERNSDTLPPIMTNQELESLFTELEELPERDFYTEEKIETIPPGKEKAQSKPITILDLPDQPEENEKKNKEGKSPFAESRKSYFERISFRILGAIIIILITLFLIIGGSIYNNLSSKQLQDEIEAARSVTDIALALVYAQVNHIHPRMQNWSDPQFLKSSLESVLSPHHLPNATLDSQGKLNGKYLLRIYTSKDSSRFVLIAQSEPSFFPWAQASDSIAVDSNSMTLRRVKDLKVLNRILINPDNLSPEGNDELGSLIEQGEIISLNDLADDDNSNGFATPEELKEVCKEGNNLLYNCPRYSQIGEKIMRKAIELAKEPNITDLKRLHEELKVIAKLKEPVLYTTKGRVEALNAKEALSNLSPKQKIFIAYLDYDPETKKTVSKLLTTNQVDRDENERILTKDGVGSHKPLEAISKAVALAEPTKEHYHSGLLHEIDEKKPLFQKLKELAKERNSTIVPLGEALVEMIQAEMSEESDEFPSKFDSLSKQFLENAIKTRDYVLKRLYEIYRQEGEIPLAEFIPYVEAAGLKKLDKSQLEEYTNSGAAPDWINGDTFNAIHNIAASNTFNELFANVENATQMIKKDDSQNPYHILLIQNLVRSQVQEKLNSFILSSDGKLPMSEFTREGLTKLKALLKKAWFFDSEEIDYFLSEYTYLIHENFLK